MILQTSRVVLLHGIRGHLLPLLSNLRLLRSILHFPVFLLLVAAIQEANQVVIVEKILTLPLGMVYN